MIDQPGGGASNRRDRVTSKDKTNNALVHLSHARSVHDCAPNKTLYLTETRETRHRRRVRRVRLSLHRCLSIRRLNISVPQTVTALSAPHAIRQCSAHPSRTTIFTSKGWITDHCVTKKQRLHWRMCEPSKTPTMSHKSQVGSGNQQRKPGRKSACTALQNFWSSRREKENNHAAPAQHRQKDVFWSPHKHAPQNGCETTQGRERIRQFMFAAALRTKHKNFPTLLDDVSSKLTRYLIGHFTTLYLTVRGSVRNVNWCHVSWVFQPVSSVALCTFAIPWPWPWSDPCSFYMLPVVSYTLLFTLRLVLAFTCTFRLLCLPLFHHLTLFFY